MSDNSKHIWEGWTVGDFIEELTFVYDMRVQHGEPFKTRKELKDWCKSEQPYYKKHIPEVYNHFLEKSGL